MSQRYLNFSGFSALLFVVACLTLLQSTQAIYEFDIYRLTAFEQDGKPLGSKVSSFTLVGTHHTGDLLRKLALIKFSEINKDTLDSLLSKKPSGLLIILPSEKSNFNEVEVWNTVRENLINKNNQIPVYFCDDNDAVQQFYEKSSSKINHHKTNRHIAHDIDSTMNFIVSASEPKLLKKVEVEDFFGVSDETAPTTKISTSTSPVILVVASYDSFSYVPDAKIGLNDFSSGAIALLNIAKQLSEFHESSKETNHNVLFYLTSSRTFNYQGLEIWLNRAENNRIVSRIEYAVLLDSLASKENLYLHSYNSDKSANQQIFTTLKSLEQIASSHSLSAQLIQSQKSLLGGKFPVVRISDSQSEVGQPREWINALGYNQDVLKKNVALLTEFLVGSVYNVSRNFQIFDQSSLNEDYLNATLSLFSSRSTSIPAIVKESPFTNELYRAFSEVVKHPFKNTYTYTNPQFYTSEKTTIRLARINSTFFDLYLFAASAAWLSVLYFVVTALGSNDPRRPTYKSLKTK